MRVKNWNMVIGWYPFTCMFPTIAYFCVEWYCLMIFIKQTLVTNCFLLSIFHNILYYFTKYGFEGSQLLHVSRVVWGCFKHNEEKRDLLNCFKANLKHVERLICFEKHKNWLLKPVYQFASSHLNLQTINKPTKFQN